jgi:predicted amidohydrolase YtcJ
MGIQVYTHAIGDGAIRRTLDAYEASVKALGERDLRNRIEHYESPYPADIDRLVRLAIAGYTAASAFAAHREKLEGTIQTGKLADFVVLSVNLLKVPASSLQRVKICKRSWAASRLPIELRRQTRLLACGTQWGLDSGGRGGKGLGHGLLDQLIENDHGTQGDE